ncbi:MAG: YtfJ family protein [Thiovulaceae bacterium]|nr:YtfJ family protein [Sulfurimonadaceae bacterium]
MRNILLILVLSTFAFAGIKVGEVPTATVIETKDGGYVTGSAFDSTVLKGKISVLMYVDPDEKSDGEALNDALDILGKTLTSKVYQKYLIINMDDTWKPNFVINKLLKSRQKDHPEDLYVTDESSVLGVAWGLEHDAYNCVISNEKGRVIYYEKGPFSKEEIQKVVTLVTKETKRLQ